MNGEALPKDHGFPVRLFVPGWYGCCCIKWVNSIALVNDSVAATSQMKEFASRTHQLAAWDFAVDYLPATMDQAAMPVRVEKWSDEGSIVYRLVGIMWGGYQPTDALTISFDGGGSYSPVGLCSKPTTVRTWSLWSHLWRPPTAGRYLVRMGISDPTIPTRRLDLGWYDREIEIDEV
jgi:DMSO/TMAO reductase YedYZ molybdopterin-dependent catalytic subunit